MSNPIDPSYDARKPSPGELMRRERLAHAKVNRERDAARDRQTDADVFRRLLVNGTVKKRDIPRDERVSKASAAAQAESDTEGTSNGASLLAALQSTPVVQPYTRIGAQPNSEEEGYTPEQSMSGRLHAVPMSSEQSKSHGQENVHATGPQVGTHPESMSEGAMEVHVFEITLPDLGPVTLNVQKKSDGQWLIQMRPQSAHSQTALLHMQSLVASGLSDRFEQAIEVQVL